MKALKLKGCELSIAVVRDGEIRALNKHWRKKDKATDVLSFPQEPPLLGDVVISIDTAQRQAKTWKRIGELLGHKVHLELAGYTSIDEVVTLPKKGATEEINLELVKGR